MAPTLAELKAEFQRISQQAARLLDVPTASLAQRPSSGGWSAAECLAHLNLSADPYFPLWKRILTEAPPAASPNYKLDLWGRVLAWMLEPPPKFRFPAPGGFHPVTANAGSVVQEFLQRQQAILATLDAAQGLAIDKVKLASPFNQRVRYSMWSSLCVTAAHERRHLWQAERAAGLGS